MFASNTVPPTMSMMTSTPRLPVARHHRFDLRFA